MILKTFALQMAQAKANVAWTGSCVGSILLLLPLPNAAAAEREAKQVAMPRLLAAHVRGAWRAGHGV